MSEILVNTIKKADGTGGLTVPSGSGTVATLAGGTFTGAIAMGANNISFSNGNGIDFSASEGSGASSSILDDYEEGSWTPALNARTTDFSSVTYNTTYTVGLYRKIGKVVYLTARVQWTAHSGGSGELRITGFPVATMSGATNQATHILNAFGSGFSANSPDAGRWFSASILELSGNGTNTTVSNMPSSGYVLLQGYYMTD